MKLYSINAGSLKLDGGAMFGVVPKVLWSKVYPADENNQCTWAMRCLLVVTESKKILIDTGAGNKQDQKFAQMYSLVDNDKLEANLKAKGFTSDEITDVVITHLHFDHCGGAVKYSDDKTQLQLVFKNANYWISKQHWEMAKNPNKKEKPSFLKENIQPIEDSGKLKLIDADTEIETGVLLKLFFGHTTGQIIPHINFNGTTVVYLADLIPSAAHIPLAYIMGYDSQPLVTLKEKEDLLSIAASKKHLMFFEHDINNECSFVEQTEKGFKPQSPMSLEAFLGC